MRSGLSNAPSSPRGIETEDRLVGRNELQPLTIEARDFSIEAAGKATEPDGLVHVRVAAQQLDLAVEFHEAIVSDLRMDFASTGFHRGIYQRCEFRNVEDVEATHPRAFSECFSWDSWTNFTLLRQSCSMSFQRPLSSSSIAASMVAVASTASGSSTSRRLRVISSGYQFGSRK